ncbi:putative monooxygenase p33MONOX [Plecturocebus cupreus]
MTPPPSDMGSILWKPVIPEYKYQHLAKVEDPPMALSLATDSTDKVCWQKLKLPIHQKLFDHKTDTEEHLAF